MTPTTRAFFKMSYFCTEKSVYGFVGVAHQSLGVIGHSLDQCAVVGIGDYIYQLRRKGRQRATDKLLCHRRAE